MHSHSQFLFALTIFVCFFCASYAKPAKKLKREAMTANIDLKSGFSSMTTSTVPIETGTSTSASSINTFVPTATPSSSSTYYSSKFQPTFSFMDTTPLSDGAEYFSWYASVESASKSSKVASKSKE